MTNLVAQRGENHRARRGATRTAPLDGIRALAVVAVVGFHFGVPGFEGGSLGVDVFFVLSGFLITSLLVREHAVTKRIRLGAFWGRRARRLFPALFLLLVGVVLYTHFEPQAVNLGSTRGDVLSTLFYVANWHFIFSGQGYFTQTGAESLLLHTWTLGVEEQYYLLWPLVAFFVLGRFGRRFLALVALGGAGASALLMGVMHVAGFSLDRLYYGTDTRAQALLVGSFVGALGSVSEWRVLPVGWTTSRRLRRPAIVLGCAGLASTVWMCHEIEGTSLFLYEGGFLLVALSVAAVIVAVVSLPDSIPARVTSLRGLAYLGRISYGVYLYHWPIALVVDHRHTGLPRLSLLVVRLVLTLVIAVLSFELWEKPIRERRFFVGWRAPVSALTAGSVVVSSVLAVGLPAAASSPRASAIGTTATAALQRPAYTAGHPVEALMIGDSVALTLDMGLGDDSERWGIDFVTGDGSSSGVQLGCDLDPGSTVELNGSVGIATPGCIGWRSKWTRLVRTYDPDVVTVLLGRWETSNRLYDGHWTHVGNADWDEHLVGELDQAVRLLSSRGAKVVLFTLPYVDPPQEAPDGSVYPENLPSRVDAYNLVLGEVASSFPGIASVVDLNRLLDPGRHFTTSVDGVVVRWSDGIHITVDGGQLIQGRILPGLVSLGLAHDQLRNSR